MQIGQADSTYMRCFGPLAAVLALASLPLARPMPAAAEDAPNWQTCVASSPDGRVNACSAVIFCISACTTPRMP